MITINCAHCSKELSVNEKLVDNNGRHKWPCHHCTETNVLFVKLEPTIKEVGKMPFCEYEWHEIEDGKCIHCNLEKNGLKHA